MGVVIEPLDYFAHKKATLGSTDEAIEICRRLAGSDLDADALHRYRPSDPEPRRRGGGRSPKPDRGWSDFHFCNAVTDTRNPLFGDRHLPFGAPGVVDVDVIAGS